MPVVFTNFITICDHIQKNNLSNPRKKKKFNNIDDCSSLTIEKSDKDMCFYYVHKYK